IHRQPWPTTDLLNAAAAGTSPAILSDCGNAVSVLRKLKTEAKVPMKTPIIAATLAVPEVSFDGVVAGRRDIAEAGKVADLKIVEATGPVELDIQGGITAQSHTLGTLEQP
ncbi:MAG: valine--tRNA ligase, partial [Cellulomonadaceae bacterium]|nr:valine--tRNA ligase [Cellulomonadaceae bacterium]